MAPVVAPALPLPLFFVAYGALLLHRTCAFDWSFFNGGYVQANAADELTEQNFHEYLTRNPITAVLYYAPWCYNSQQMMPEWDVVGQKLHLHDPPVHVAKINTHLYKTVGEEYKITDFPTIKLFVNGAVFDYGNLKDAKYQNWQLLVKWVNHHLDRGHILSTVQDVDDFLHHNELAVIGLSSDGESDMVSKAIGPDDDVMFAEVKGPHASALAKHISQFASMVCETVYVGPSQIDSMTVALPRPGMWCEHSPKNPQRPEWPDEFRLEEGDGHFNVTRVDRAGMGWRQHLSFQCCSHPSNVEGKDIPVPSVVMFMPHDERFAVFRGSLSDVDALGQWIQARRHPMIVSLSDATEDLVMTQTLWTGQPVLLYVDSHYNESDHGTPVMQELLAASMQLRGRILIVCSSTTSKVSKQLMEIAGIPKEHLPVLTLIENVVGMQQATLNKFRLPVSNLASTSVVKFVDDYFDHSLTPYLRSEAVPSGEERRVSHVWVLVGSTFKAFAEDPKYDVFVDLYAPWCGHCRKLEPSYKALANRLKHVKSLRIAKMDATRNELDNVVIRGYPTILLYPANREGSLQYTGNRKPDDMVRWLKRHCTIGFDETPPEEQDTGEPDSGLLNESEEDL